MINVDLGDGRIFPMEEHLLEGPYLSVRDSAADRAETVEYKLKGKVVHRSVKVHLKQGLGIEGFLGRVG